MNIPKAPQIEDYKSTNDWLVAVQKWQKVIDKITREQSRKFICVSCPFKYSCPFVCLNSLENQYLVCPKEPKSGEFNLYLSEVKEKKLGRAWLN